MSEKTKSAIQTVCAVISAGYIVVSAFLMGVNPEVFGLSRDHPLRGVAVFALSFAAGLVIGFWLHSRRITAKIALQNAHDEHVERIKREEKDKAADATFVKNFKQLEYESKRVVCGINKHEPKGFIIKRSIRDEIIEDDAYQYLEYEPVSDKEDMWHIAPWCINHLAEHPELFEPILTQGEHETNAEDDDQ